MNEEEAASSWIDPEDQFYNVHYAKDPQQCRKMGRLNNWKLKKVKKTKDDTLKAKCMFEGKQTTFMQDD